MTDATTATVVAPESLLLAVEYDHPQEALAVLVAGDCTPEQYAEWQTGREAMLKAQAARTAKSSGRITLKVSEKGGVSIYGMGKWPITLYREQWARLFENREGIELFIKANLSVLKSKEAKAAEVKAASIES